MNSKLLSDILNLSTSNVNEYNVWDYINWMLIWIYFIAYFNTRRPNQHIKLFIDASVYKKC